MTRLLAFALLLAAGLAAALPARAEIREVPDAVLSPREVECMALNIYWEAARGNELDLRAVAHVTMNRATSAGFPGDVCGVVQQGGETRNACQFHWWCDGRSDEPTDLAAWRRALGIAEKVLSGADIDPTGGALYFHNATVKPSWTRTLEPTVKIGNHQFYR